MSSSEHPTGGAVVANNVTTACTDTNAPKGPAHQAVQRFRHKGVDEFYMTPQLPVNAGRAPQIIYQSKRMGKPVVKGATPEGPQNLYIYKRARLGHGVTIDTLAHPQWRYRLFDDTTGKLRALTLKDWDAISGGSEAKDFDINAHIKSLRPNSNEKAPLYSAEYIAKHKARRQRYKKRAADKRKAATTATTGAKTAAPKKKKAKTTSKSVKKSAANATATSNATPAQVAAMQRARGMTRAALMTSPDIVSVLTKAQLVEVLTSMPSDPE